LIQEIEKEEKGAQRGKARSVEFIILDQVKLDLKNDANVYGDGWCEIVIQSISRRNEENYGFKTLFS
jgi:hypothetical protein